MALDARSRKLLEELGRSLPQPLPVPESAAEQPAPVAPAGRHRIETETDPEVLFRELMQASPDGSVPPHLLDRLRQLERKPPASNPRGETPAAPPAKGAGPTLQRKRLVRQDPQYVEFEQLLLEDDD